MWQVETWTAAASGHGGGRSGDGAPLDVHPNQIHRGRKVNHHQRIPYTSVDSIKKAMEFEAISDIFSEPFEFQRVNGRSRVRVNPAGFRVGSARVRVRVPILVDPKPFGQLDMVTGYQRCFAAQCSATSPCYPFAGFMINFRVVTDAHKDGLDSQWCLIIFVKRGKGGHTCLWELDLRVNGKTGNMLNFMSRWVTHFNSHFEGKRCSLVLHTDREGKSWVENGGGWAGHLAMDLDTYTRSK
ncbi:hypothetical protein B0H11DRAFT_1901415 [Mycena galericulata]|nr:hypothetical protein B0H11DRAFT_1901415 [Mycena galericulata]